MPRRCQCKWDAPPGVSSLGSATQHDEGGRRPRFAPQALLHRASVHPAILSNYFRSEVVNNPLACQDAFRDDRMGMWRMHVHQQRLHVPRLSDDDDGSCRSPPPPPPPPPLPAYDVAQLQAGEAVGPEGVDANKFDFLAKGVIPCVFFQGMTAVI